MAKGNWRADLAEIQRARGYIIFGSNTHYARGAIFTLFIDLDGQRHSHPFRIVGETDREDFVGQLTLLGTMYSWIEEYQPSLNPEDHWDHYYVVETD
jgi:hypothetical protein